MKIECGRIWNRTNEEWTPERESALKLQSALSDVVALVWAGSAAAGVVQQGATTSEAMRKALSTLDPSSTQSGVLPDIGPMFAIEALTMRLGSTPPRTPAWP